MKKLITHQTINISSTRNQAHLIGNVRSKECATIRFLKQAHDIPQR